jgi:hypothetical protein
LHVPTNSTQKLKVVEEDKQFTYIIFQHFPCSHNGDTAHDETGVEANGRSRWAEISSQSQRREGVNVAAGVETGVDFEKK